MCFIHLILVHYSSIYCVVLFVANIVDETPSWVKTYVRISNIRLSSIIIQYVVTFIAFDDYIESMLIYNENYLGLTSIMLSSHHPYNV